jgi:CMP-N-acetylneuraminic acid synthetase
MPENKNRIWNYEAKIRTALKNASSGKTTVHPDSSYYWHRRQLLALNDVIFSVAHELYTCDESRTTEIAVILDELVERFYKEWNEFSSYLIPVEDQAQNGQVKE